MDPTDTDSDLRWMRSHGGRVLHAVPPQKMTSFDARAAVCGFFVHADADAAARDALHLRPRPHCRACTLLLAAAAAAAGSTAVQWSATRTGSVRHAWRALPAGTAPATAPPGLTVISAHRRLPPVRTLCGKVFTPAPTNTERKTACDRCEHALAAERGILPEQRPGMLF